jgi:hypothetical protein
LYIIQASRAGGLGTIAFVVIIFGTSLASWIFSSGVSYVPVIAAQAPELFSQIENQTILLGIVSVLSWILGNVLFGVSVIRSNVFPRWTGVLLVLGSLVIPAAYLIGLAVKVVVIGTLLVGTSQIGLGYDLLHILRKSASSA